MSEAGQEITEQNTPKSPVEEDAFDKPNKDSTSVGDHIKNKSIWLRLFFMVVISLIYSVSRVVMAAVVVLQFFWVLFTGERNEKLKCLGESLSVYTYQIVLYLTFNTEERPYPFEADWPSSSCVIIDVKEAGVDKKQ